MNVFVLCAGRCGSHTIAYAFSHATNYTVGHEWKDRLIGSARLAYPDNHIEVDNRLAWMLGRLDWAYGKDAFYIHLRRDCEATATSHAHKYVSRPFTGNVLVSNYINGIARIAHAGAEFNALDAARDMVDTVTANIAMFLKDKPRRREVWIEELEKDLPIIWKDIGAEGDLDAALKECRVKFSATDSKKTAHVRNVLSAKANPVKA